MAREAVDMTSEGTADRVIRVVIGLGLLPSCSWGRRPRGAGSVSCRSSHEGKGKMKPVKIDDAAAVAKYVSALK
jgi:hypothetical protein